MHIPYMQRNKHRTVSKKRPYLYGRPYEYSICFFVYTVLKVSVALWSWCKGGAAFSVIPRPPPAHRSGAGGVAGACPDRKLAPQFVMPRHQNRGYRFACWWRKRAGARSAPGGASQNAGCAYPASFGSSHRTCVQRRARGPSAYIYTAGDYGLITGPATPRSVATPRTVGVRCARGCLRPSLS